MATAFGSSVERSQHSQYHSFSAGQKLPSPPPPPPPTTPARKASSLATAKLAELTKQIADLEAEHAALNETHKGEAILRDKAAEEKAKLEETYKKFVQLRKQSEKLLKEGQSLSSRRDGLVSLNRNAAKSVKKLMTDGTPLTEEEWDNLSKMQENAAAAKKCATDRLEVNAQRAKYPTAEEALKHKITALNEQIRVYEENLMGNFLERSDILKRLTPLEREKKDLERTGSTKAPRHKQRHSTHSFRSPPIGSQHDEIDALFNTAHGQNSEEERAEAAALAAYAAPASSSSAPKSRKKAVAKSEDLEASKEAKPATTAAVPSAHATAKSRKRTLTKAEESEASKAPKPAVPTSSASSATSKRRKTNADEASKNLTLDTSKTEKSKSLRDRPPTPHARSSSNAAFQPPPPPLPPPPPTASKSSSSTPSKKLHGKEVISIGTFSE